MSPPSLPLAILFADVSGSTRLYETLGDQIALAQIGATLALLEQVTLRHGGAVVKTIGDEIMCTFPGADSATEAAVAMQKALDAKNSAGESTLHIRVGLQFGQAIREGADVFGDAVNVAARMAALARAGQIITTLQTVEALPPALRADTRPLGSAAVKGKREEIEICEIIWQNNGEMTMLPNRPAPAFTPARACLTLRHAGLELTLNRDRPAAVLGRDKGGDMVVDDPLASRQHAKLELRAGKFILSDQSTNGTYLTTADGKNIRLHREDAPLTGSGFFALGHEADGAAAEVIHYVCGLY